MREKKTFFGNKITLNLINGHASDDVKWTMRNTAYVGILVLYLLILLTYLHNIHDIFKNGKNAKTWKLTKNWNSKNPCKLIQIKNIIANIIAIMSKISCNLNFK